MSNDACSKEVCISNRDEVNRRFSELKDDMRAFDKMLRDYEMKGTRIYAEFNHLKAELDSYELRHKESVGAAIALGLVDSRIKDEAFEAMFEELAARIKTLSNDVVRVDDAQDLQAQRMSQWKHTSIGIFITMTAFWAIFKFIFPLFLKGSVTP